MGLWSLSCNIAMFVRGSPLLAVLMAGASISKVLLVFKHLGLAAFTPKTFFYHQSKLVFPTILLYWEFYQKSLIQSLKNIGDIVWCGDGRFDSMGHSAKYGAYTMFCTIIMKIVHLNLLQVINLICYMCLSYVHYMDYASLCNLTLIYGCLCGI